MDNKELEKLYSQGKMKRVEYEGLNYYRVSEDSKPECKKAESMEIFDYFISVFNTPSKYRYKAKTLLDLQKCLKEYDKKSLIHAIDSYKESLKDFRGKPSPRYFFAMSSRSEHYRKFEGFLPQQTTIDEQIKKRALTEEVSRLKELYYNRQSDDYKKLWHERFKNNVLLPVPPEYQGARSKEFYEEHNLLRELLANDK